jgi:DNA-directed RNA polymerase specialized sigma24 family protein
MDELRRARPTGDGGAGEPVAPEEAPTGYEQLAELADGLPPKERAAVVLRYAYDLDYETIGAALGSSPDAARQAASSGVRRLRKELT